MLDLNLVTFRERKWPITTRLVLKWVLSIVAGLLVPDAGAAVEREIHIRPRVPVIIQADTSFDACFGSGKVKGLDPNSESFLAVRSGPGLKFSRIDKLHGHRLDRESLVSALVKKVQRQDRFLRTDKNVFALRKGGQ